MSYSALALVGNTATFVLTSTFLSSAYYAQLWTFYTFAITLLWLQRDLDKRQLEQEEEDVSTGKNLAAMPIAPDNGHSDDD